MIKVCFLPSTLIRYRDLGSLVSSTPFLNLMENKVIIFPMEVLCKEDSHRLKLPEKTFVLVLAGIVNFPPSSCCVLDLVREEC